MRQSQQTRGGSSTLSSSVVIQVPPIGIILLRTTVAMRGGDILMAGGDRSTIRLEPIIKEVEDEVGLSFAAKFNQVVLNIGKEHWAAQVEYI